jgi:hypothetical protein
MPDETRTECYNQRPCEPGRSAVSHDRQMTGQRSAHGINGGPARLRVLRWMSFAIGSFLTVCPHLAWASGSSENDPAQVFLANVTPLTAEQMAHESAGALPVIVPLPSPEANQPKIHLWDELSPSTVSTLQNGSSSVSVHFGP